jgi:hypothetical protein
MILRDRVSNAGAPLAYSTWNLPPNSPFSGFVSNPPARDGSPGHSVRPSPEDIETLIAPLQNPPKAKRQTHFEMPYSIDDAEMDVVLSLLAGESSDSIRTEPMAIAAGQELGEDVEIQKPECARQKHSRRVNRPAALVEEKKRRLRRLSCLDQDAGPSALFLGDGLVDAIPEVSAEGCDDAQAAGGVFDEDEEEEEEIPLIHKNNHHYRGSDGGSDIPSQALSALVSLQGLSISDFDQALEEVILEDILSEPPEADIPTICSEVPDGGLSLHDSAGQEVTWVVSHASLTLEGSLPCKSTDLSHPAPMDVAEGPLTLEVAATENPALKGGSGSDLAPESVGAGSLSAASMNVDVGSPPVRSEEAAVTHVSMALAGQLALEASEPDERSLPPVDGAKVTPSHALEIIPADLPSLSHAPTLPALGLPLFISNLQVSQLLLFIVHTGELSFLLICPRPQDFIGGVSTQLRSCGATVPDQASSLMQWNPLLLQKQIDDLKASNIG